ncbi:MAG: class I SAM-dependent methyltransferase [Dehalococcoidia bacterium]|nr:MAG: class I SAM-dependent methyltransferase [Dehalococcoidia bacterium]
MVKPRIVETDHGITGEITTRMYDVMMRNMRDKGWIETNLILGEEISSGLALEIGPGPGYRGLEWLKRTKGTHLEGLEISEDMIALARKNAVEYGLSGRVKYYKGDAQQMPFKDGYFDAVFTNGSLHEWSNPQSIFNEIVRVIKPGGKYLISDLRRDMNPAIKGFLWLTVKPKEMRPGLMSSLDASYTISEISAILTRTKLQDWKVSQNPFGIVVSGRKQ